MEGIKVFELIKKFDLEQKLRSRRTRIFLAAAAVLLVVLSCVAVRPAFSAEKVLVCTAGEHTHSEECYTSEPVSDAARLGCGVKAHSHSEKCLDEQGTVVCGKADYIIHSHNEYCTDNNGKLLCSLSEKSGTAHSHSDACYDENDSLICGKVIVSAHNHSAQCIDSSLPAEKSVLSCTLEEHTHGDECYTTVEDKTSSGDAADEKDNGGTETTAPAVSGGDAADSTVSGADSSDADKPQTGPMLFSAQPAAPLADDGNIYAKLNETLTLDIRKVGYKPKVYFIPESTHKYTFKISCERDLGIIYLNKSDERIGSFYYYSSDSARTFDLTAGETYFLEFKISGASQVFTVTPVNGTHVFKDGICSCGLNLNELNGTCGDDARWSFANGKLTISGTGAVTSSPWNVIPECITSVEIGEGITSIFKECFQNLPNIESIELPEGFTSIPPSMCYYCQNLTHIAIPDSVKSIGTYAFYDTALSSLYLPESLTSIDSYALKTSSNIAIHFNCKNLTNVKSSSIPSIDKITSLTVGKKVDVIDKNFSDYILSKLGSNCELIFEGENYFSVSKDTSAASLKKTILSGDYYVDKNGALYKIDKEDGTALLINVPDDTSSYTIPATIPSEDSTEDPLKVIGVEKDALASADKLTSLTFASPESITYLPDGSCSNCMTLSSVNGKTTVEEAFAVFVNASDNTANGVFANTALSNDFTASNDDLGIYDEQDASVPIIKVSLQKNDGSNNAEFAGTNTFYTGEYAKVSIGISSASSTDYEATRVYFAFDSDGGELGWPFGERVLRTDTGKEYTINICRSDIKNIYYIECPRLDEGDTISAILNTFYPSPSTEGGKVKIWPVVLRNGELSSAGNSVIFSSPYNQAEWVTKADDFNVSTLDYTFTAVGPRITGYGSNYDLVVNDLAYEVIFKRNGNTLQGMGKDHIQKLRLTSTITLPEGLEWDEDLIDAVNAGNYGFTFNTSSSGYFYASINGQLSSFASISNLSKQATVEPEASFTDKHTLVLKYTYINNSYLQKELDTTTYYIRLCRGTSSTSDGNYDLGDNNLRPSYIKVVDDTPLKSYSIIHKIECDQTFCYSENQQDTASYSASVTSGEADINILKSNHKPISRYRGNRYNYAISIWNETGYKFSGLSHISDPLPSDLYIPHEELRNMFNAFPEQSEGQKNLVITISHAKLCSDNDDAYSPGSSVITSDGTTAVLSHANSSIDHQYHGCATTDYSVYDGDATLVLTCSADGSQTLVYGEKTISTSDIAQALESIGYVCQPSTTFEVRWNFVDNFTLKPGVTHEFVIPSYFKTVFMMLPKDTPNSLDAFSFGKNTAYAYYYDSSNSLKHRASTVDSNSLNEDFELTKSAVINNDKSITSVVNGDIITYTVSLSYGGSALYDPLPLVDRMTGAQVLLVPAGGQEHLAEEYGLEMCTIGSIDYFPLDAVGTYRNVYVGNAFADSITVTAQEGGGHETMIRWYYADFQGSSSSTSKETITYRTIVDTAATNEYDLTYSLTNECWLNDHPTHRLYAASFGIGGTAVEFSKNIVLDKGDTPENDALAVFSPLREGESTTYRLTIRSLGGPVTIDGDLFYDRLPLMYDDVFVWSKDNISLSYEPAQDSTFTFTGADNEDATWSVKKTPSSSPETSAVDDQSYICWNSDMQMTINGTLHIYVTLDMPEGDVWHANASVYYNTRLTNTFILGGESSIVYHDLALESEVCIQKGVNRTGVRRNNSSSSFNYTRISDNARLHFINSAAYGELIEYYVVLYNSGQTRLYIDRIYDVLPKGVTPLSIGSMSSQEFDILDANGTAVSAKLIDPRLTYSYNSTTRTLSIGITSGTSYDSLLKKYYINPNEAIKFSVTCTVGPRSSTEDFITNTVAVPYYDYLGDDVELGNYTIKMSKNNLPDNVAYNDGIDYIKDTTWASSLGLPTSLSSNSQWIVSDVTLKRGNIIPGVTKAVTGSTTTNGSSSSETEFAGPGDTVHWLLSLSNAGSDSIYDWTFSDIVDADYGFTGPVTADFYLSSADKPAINNSGNIYFTSMLFNIDRDENDLDKITIDFFNGQKTTVTRGEYAESTNKYNDGTTCSFKVRIYVNEDGKEVLECRVISESRLIDAGGKVDISLSTKNFGAWSNKVYYNNAVLTPNTQEFDSSLISRGNFVYFGEDNLPSVRNSAQITAAYGYVTSSEKRVFEVGNETNSASSRGDNNIMFFDGHKDIFRYTNIIKNVTDKPISQIVMIDNLPEVGDHSAFTEAEARFSAFKVRLCDDPQFKVSVVSGGTTTVLDPSQYELMFSERTSFTSDDWNDSSDAGWSTTPTASSRSFRLSLYDDTGAIIPDEASLQVEYSCVIVMADDFADDDVTSDPKPGTVAWNSFGYRYKVKGESIYLEAAPLKVGICTKDLPAAKKELVAPDGSAYIAEKDETFRFLIYTGSKIDSLAGCSEEQIAQLLSNNNRTAAIYELTVSKGKSSSDILPLADLKSVTYDSASGAWTENGDWSFTENQRYTVIELEDEDSMYHNTGIGSSASDSFTFTFSSTNAIRINAVNERDSWTARINKVDAAEGKPLAGAVFGLYSADKNDLISDDALEAASLDRKPDKTIKHDGATWYLTQIGESDVGGAVLFDGLIAERYLAVELQAPGGYMIDDSVIEFELSDADDELISTKQFENTADYELPKTGSQEVSTVMLWSNMLILVSLVILFINKRYIRENN